MVTSPEFFVLTTMTHVNISLFQLHGTFYVAQFINCGILLLIRALAPFYCDEASISIILTYKYNVLINCILFQHLYQFDSWHLPPVFWCPHTHHSCQLPVNSDTLDTLSWMIFIPVPVAPSSYCFTFFQQMMMCHFFHFLASQLLICQIQMSITTPCINLVTPVITAVHIRPCLQCLPLV